MVESGIYNPEIEWEKICFRFCFSRLVQKKLNDCKSHWNTHHIRKSDHSNVHGRPNQLLVVLLSRLEHLNHQKFHLKFDKSMKISVKILITFKKWSVF